MKKLVGRAVGLLAIGILGILIGTSYNIMYHYPDTDGTLVSYEYTKPCKECGEPLEGYHSFVDDYTREYCPSCGYYWEGEER